MSAFKVRLRMLRPLLLALALVSSTGVWAQIKVGENPLQRDSASLIEIESTTQGFLPSRMTTAQRDAQTAWKQGHVIYNLTEDCLQSYDGTVWECLTDDQVVDMFTISGDTLYLSIENDSEAAKAIDLSSYLDDINIYKDNGTLTGVRTVATGGNTFNLSHLGNVTTFDPSGTDLTLSSTDTAELSISSITGSLDLYVTSGAGADAIIEAGLGIDDLIIRNADTTSGSDLSLATSNDIKFTIYNTGQINLEEYGLGVYDDASPARLLSVQADGDLVETDISNVGTDDQVIDQFVITNDTLFLSLEDDGVNPQSVDLTPYVNTDNQQLSLVANELILTNDASNVDLSAFLDNTDDQTIDTLSFSGTTLSISLEDDAEAAQTVDLSGINTDDQGVDVLTISNDSLLISLEDNATTSRVDLSAFLDDTDDQGVDSLSISNDSLLISLDDNATISRLDLSAFLDDTDDQGVDVLSISNDSLLISLDDNATVSRVDLSSFLDDTDDQTAAEVTVSTTNFDMNLSSADSTVQRALETLDDLVAGAAGDTSLYNNNGTLEGNRTVTLGGSSLTFDGTSTGDVIIEADGDVGIGTTSPGARLDIAGGQVRFSAYDSSLTTYLDTLAVYMLGTDGEGDVVQMNTAKNARWFYAPAVNIDASATDTSLTLDLHQEYVDQFSQPQFRSTGAPGTIPHYDQDELWYYITFYDNTVLDNISIDANGMMTYDIIDVPFDNYTIVNVIFVIK